MRRDEFYRDMKKLLEMICVFCILIVVVVLKPEKLAFVQPVTTRTNK